jgi:hypothetical protein
VKNTESTNIIREITSRRKIQVGHIAAVHMGEMRNAYENVLSFPGSCRAFMATIVALGSA